MVADNTLQSHPLQSIAWEKFRNEMGVDTARVNDWLLTFHPIPFTPWTVGYFPKGPAPTAKMIQDISRLGKEKNAVFIQMEPNVTESERGKLSYPTLVPSHHPLFTKYSFVLDLSRSEDELLKAMHPKTRYNIRLAQKHGVVVQEDNSREAFAAYLKLTRETTDRQGFYAHNATYHETMWRILHEAGIAHLFTATYKNDILAAWIIFVWDKTAYYPYGASSRHHREVMAPNLMLWEIVRWAKKRGLSRFDLWGAIGPNPDPQDPWYGFHRFKEGFRPDLIEYVGSFDLVLKPLLYRIVTFISDIRWWLLKRRRI